MRADSHTMRQRLSSRLLISTALSLGGTMLVIVLLLLALFHWTPEILIKQELQSSAEHMIERLHFNADGSVKEVALTEIMQVVLGELKSDNAYRVLDASGALLLSSDGGTGPFVADGGGFSASPQRFDVDHNGVTQYVWTEELVHAGKKYYVQVMRSDRLHKAMMGAGGGKVRIMTIGTVIVAMVVFSIVVIATMNNVLTHLRRVSAAAAQIGPHKLADRLSTEGLPGELIPLIEAFNAALERVEKGFLVQREFLATAAHELKTPLALIRGQLELDGVSDRDTLLKDIDQMARQVYQLLHLAEVSERQNYKFAPLAIAPIISDVVSHLERLAQQKDVMLEWSDTAEHPLISGDSGAIFILVRNLVENAIYHSAPHTTVSICLDSSAIVVQDRGPGVDPEIRQLIFKRFWRGAHRRDDGAGLGLSICQEITTAHFWDIVIEDGNPGARFLVVFNGEKNA